MEPGLPADTPRLSHDMAAGKIHLLCGPTASGKTTLAKDIESERGAVRFSIDERMAPPNYPAQPNPAFIMELIQKAQPVFMEILTESHQHLSCGNGVVLDVGAFHRSTRDFARNWATSIARPLTLYYLSVGRNIRLERLRQRNKLHGKTYAFDVPEWVFEWIEREFQAPTDDEKPIIITDQTKHAGRLPGRPFASALSLTR